MTLPLGFMGMNIGPTELLVVLAIVLVLFGGKKLRAKCRSTSADVLASALIRLAEAPAHDLVVDGDDLR